MPLLVPSDDATSWVRLPFLSSSKYARLAQDERDETSASPSARLRRRGLDIPWQQWTVLGLAVVLFAAAVVIFKTTVTRSLQVDRLTADGHLRMQAFWPYVPQVEVQFDDFPEYRATDGVGDRAWNELIPAGGGYVEVRDPRQYDMPASVPVDRAGETQVVEVYSTSATHQLRCLARLRSELIAQSQHTSSEQPSSEIWHCLDYLRQAILCAGDTSLEAGKASHADDGKARKTAFDGAGTIHRCRSWRVIEQVMTSRRPSNLSLSIIDS